MDLNKNFLRLVCFLTSILGLFLIYLAAKNIQPQKVKLGEITSELIGKTVTINGKIVYKKYHPAGHLFLSLSDDKQTIQVPLFSSLMEELARKGFSVKNFTKGKSITITGLVSEYKGQLQVIPRKVNDISLG